MSHRENMKKPEFMSDEDWEMIKDQTSSLERIRRDAKADVEDYLADLNRRHFTVEVEVTTTETL